MTQAIDLSPISAADLDDHWFTLLLRVWREVRTAVKSTAVEQKVLAERIGMNAGQFSKIITGKKGNITLRTLHNIARAAGYRLKVSLEPLSSLRKPNDSFDASRLDRKIREKNQLIVRRTETSTDGDWTKETFGTEQKVPEPA